jgi:ribosome maturation factor RimP
LGEDEMDVEALVRPVVEASGLELVEAVFRGEGGRRVLRVTVDREGGVDLDTIAVTSERISRRLDLEGFSPGPYQLEVSSPGLERNLREPGQFARAVGEQVRLKVTAEAGARVVEGTLTGADEEGVTVATATGVQRAGYAEIASARTIFEWRKKEAR